MQQSEKGEDSTVDGVIDLIYDSEAEKAKELKEIDKEFEIQLNCFINDFFENKPGYTKEELRDRIFSILMPMKKEIFVYGFKRGMQMLIEGIS